MDTGGGRALQVLKVHIMERRKKIIRVKCRVAR
jgi:hypothetical protein